MVLIAVSSEYDLNNHDNNQALEDLSIFMNLLQHQYQSLLNHPMDWCRHFAQSCLDKKIITKKDAERMSRHADVKSILVAWCRDCLYWVDKEQIGDPCLVDDCERKLIKRRFYIHSDCGCSYETLAEYREHDCYAD